MNPDFPPKPPESDPIRTSRHRRSQSDTFFHLSDDFDLDLSSLPTNSNNNPFMTVDSPTSSDCFSRPPPPISHLRSVSVDADFFQPDFDAGGNSGEKRLGFHRRNGSSSSFEADSAIDGFNRAINREKLAELALIDPKKARRILSNRQSAARSKERRIQYTGELERKVQTLQTEATSLSTQVTMLQRDSTGLTAENRELKLRLQALEQQAQLKDALNDTLKQEVQRLRIEAGQIPSTNFNTPNRSFSGFNSRV